MDIPLRAGTTTDGEGGAYDIYYDNDSGITLQIQQGLDINFMRG